MNKKNSVLEIIMVGTMSYLCLSTIFVFVVGLMSLYELDIMNCVSFASDGARKGYSYGRC